MTDHMPDDLSPAGRDIRAYTDELRPKHPVVRNDRGDYVLLRHGDVRAAALDDATFSSAVSAHLQIPNGLDGDRHDLYRSVLDPFLSEESIEPFLGTFERVATELAAEIPLGLAVDAVTQVGARYAVRAQSAWLGWPRQTETALVAWVAANRSAARDGDRDLLAQVAIDFDGIINAILEPRRTESGEVIGDDGTAALMRTEVAGQPLTPEEVVSVLRNWTGGDLGSIALCVGVVLHYLATEPNLQDRLRDESDDAAFDAAIDEILRIDDPFVTNRRTTTRPVEIAGVNLPARARVKLNWTSANRDESVFGDPDEFDPVGHAADNLVYGIGRHACPGRRLATVELRIAIRALLGATTSITLAPDRYPQREAHPVGGWADVPVVFT